MEIQAKEINVNLPFETKVSIHTSSEGEIFFNEFMKQIKTICDISGMEIKEGENVGPLQFVIAGRVVKIYEDVHKDALKKLYSYIEHKLPDINKTDPLDLIREIATEESRKKPCLPEEDFIKPKWPTFPNKPEFPFPEPYRKGDVLCKIIPFPHLFKPQT